MKTIEKNITFFASRMMVLVIFLFLLQSGCGKNFSTEMSAASETKAMSLLKQYQAAQNAYRMESDGRYGTLSELISRELVHGELAKACNSNSQPVAVNGYLFSEIETGDMYKRAGLCAYPKSGKGKVILMLLDIDDADEWAFYTADSSKSEGKVTAWPSESDLQAKFTRLRKYSPKEGVAEASKLADKVRPANN